MILIKLKRIPKPTSFFYFHRPFHFESCTAWDGLVKIGLLCHFVKQFNAMKRIPTAVMEAILNLSLIDVTSMEEPRIRLLLANRSDHKKIQEVEAAGDELTSGWKPHDPNLP